MTVLTSLTTNLRSSNFGVKFTTPPLRLKSGAALGITPGRTVDICGRCSGHLMVAIRLPPKAGRVISNSWVSSLMVSLVQSAVRPVPRRAAMRGARSRPMVVAPNIMIEGLKATTAW